MPAITPNRVVILGFAPVAVVAAVIGAALAIDGARAARLPGADDGAPALSPLLSDARARTACDQASWADCRRQASHVLDARPADGRAWLELARADAGSNRGRLGADGLRALARSRQVDPLSTPTLVPRLRLEVEHWSDLPTEARARIGDELRAASIAGGPTWTAAEGLCHAARDPDAHRAVCAAVAGLIVESASADAGRPAPPA